jgi:hypothetical protein
MQKLVEPLVQLVKSGATKPAQRIDGIYALLLVAKIAAVDVGSDDVLMKEKIWNIVLQKDSVLLSPSLVKRFFF